MGAWRVQTEPGKGLRLIPGNGGHACGPGHTRSSPGKGEGAGSGFLAVPERITALAVWGRTIYAAIDAAIDAPGSQPGSRHASADLLQIDARRPEAPVLVRRIRRSRAPHAGLASPILGLGAIGTRLYLLTRQGLELLDAAAPGDRAPERHPEITGRGIRVSGRLLHVTTRDGSIVVYRDTTRAPLRFEVAVNEDFYSPQHIVVDVGDEVRWTNASGTSHNVVSCTPDQDGCEGSTSAEPFDSGDPELFFVFDHVFTQDGANPYFCEPHPYMTGSVTVMGTTGSPPGVPDGGTGAPMTVQRLSVDGSTLAISWDAAACSGAADHEILFGYPYSLPPATGSGYEPAGSRCAIGTVSPFVWNGAPPSFPGPSGLLWWLVVATDGSATEGSWGKAGNGLERQGPGPGGASLECGIVAKSLSNACGH